MFCQPKNYTDCCVIQLNGLSVLDIKSRTRRKSNEITALPKLIQLLELKGCIVTIDAMGCQRSMATELWTQQADYVLALKGNQKGLYDNVRDFLDVADPFLNI